MSSILQQYPIPSIDQITNRKALLRKVNLNLQKISSPRISRKGIVRLKQQQQQQQPYFKRFAQGQHQPVIEEVSLGVSASSSKPSTAHGQHRAGLARSRSGAFNGRQEQVQISQLLYKNLKTIAPKHPYVITVE